MINHENKFIFVHVPKTGGTSIERAYGFNQTGQHSTIRDYRKHDVNGYKSFAYIRNPWTWVVSYYRWIRVPEEHHRMIVYASGSFEDFIGNLPEIHSLIPLQSWYLTDKDGNLCVDYIARFENFSEEFENINRFLGISDLPVLGHYQDTQTPDPNDMWDFYYREKASRDVVAELYKEDIDLFGFTFKGTSTKNIGALNENTSI